MGEDSLIRTRKVIVSIDRGIDKILTILFLILFFLGIYFAYDSYYVFNSSALNTLAGYRPVNGNTSVLKTLSEDVVAWIEIYETKIDYPVMQGKDNSEYLNKNAYGDYSLSGAIFLDSYNSPDFTDDYNILYGHHMSGGYMFGAIDAFEDEEYFDKHRTGLLTTVDGVMYDVTLYAFLETDANEDMVFDLTIAEEAGSTGIRNFIRRSSKIFRGDEIYRGRGAGSGAPLINRNIIALSTCKSPLTTERTVLFGALTPHDSRLSKFEIKIRTRINSCVLNPIAITENGSKRENPVEDKKDSPD